MQKLNFWCSENNIVLIFDEIITGIRTGVKCAQEIYNVTPDLTLLGKAISGGVMPVSVIGGNKRIMSLIEDNSVIQAGTFNGYHAGLAAVKSTLDILMDKDRRLLHRMNEKSRLMQNGLKEICESLDIPISIQGHDSCFYIHINQSKLQSTEEWSDDIKKKDSLLQQKFLEEGIMLAPTSRVYPTIDLSIDDVDFFLEKAKVALRKLKPIIV